MDAQKTKQTRNTFFIKGPGGQKNLNVITRARQSCKLVHFHYLFTSNGVVLSFPLSISILPISISMSFLLIHFSSVKSRLFAAHLCADQQQMTLCHPSKGKAKRIFLFSQADEFSRLPLYFWQPALGSSKQHRWDESQTIQWASDWMRKHEQRFKSHTRLQMSPRQGKYYEDENKQWKTCSLKTKNKNRSLQNN